MKVIDMHCDTILRIYDSKNTNEPKHLLQNDFQIDIAKLQKSHYLIQNFAMFVDIKATDDPYQTAKDMIECYYEEMAANIGTICPITHFSEISQNAKDGKISALLTMEEGAPLQGSLEKLQEFYDLGVRMLTLTWNHPNEIGFPNAAFSDQATGLLLTDDQKGLTKAGIDIVQKMNDIGMIIDVSHGSDQLVCDVLTYTDRPFVASHSDARSVCPHFRNLPDELIRDLSERGGVIGINFSEGFLHDTPHDHLIDAIVSHVKHFYQIGGIDCIGMGSDFDGIAPHPDLADATVMPAIYEALRNAGFSANECDQIFYQNVLRLYKEFL